MDAELFNRGVKPAINVGTSVSRVGGAAQTAPMREVAANLRLELAQYEEVAHFARLGADVDEATLRRIARGERVRAALMQPAERPMSLVAQVLTLLAATEGHLDAIPLPEVRPFLDGVLDHLDTQAPELCARIGRGDRLGSEGHLRVAELLGEYGLEWQRRRADDENGHGGHPSG